MKKGYYFSIHDLGLGHCVGTSDRVFPSKSQAEGAAIAFISIASQSLDEPDWTYLVHVVPVDNQDYKLSERGR